MPYTLRDFHFNSQKLAQILKQLCKDKGVTLSYIHKCTDITRDTLENIWRGSVRDIKFEQLFKICCVLELPMAVIEMLMIKDEDIDFADKVVLYDTSSGDVMPVTDVNPDQVPVSDTVVAVAEAVAAAEKPPEPVRNPIATDEYVAFLHQHIEQLTRLLEIAMRKEA